MARFVDLDEEPEAAEAATWPSTLRRRETAPPPPASHAQHDDSFRDAVPVSRAQEAMTEALGCYPIVVAVATHIDLNTLDALARVCRGVHNGLVQYRSVLLTSTLHCSREAAPVSPEAGLRYRARAPDFYTEDGRSCNGKSGRCARDMVQDCRRCGDVICRNCAIKPPASGALQDRHRRLCVTCARAPVNTLLGPSSSSEAARQSACTCQTRGVWLCQPCGRSIRTANCEYRQIWHWRSHYGEILGGLGTGIGDGDRGVICGRETSCLAAREIEHEVDCDAEDARLSTPGALSPISVASSVSTASTTGAEHASSSSSAVATTSMSQMLLDGLWRENERAPSPQLGPGYERHEIEGIGGKVKRKLVRMVRVGACVPEGIDETSFGGRLLGAEVRGDARSWCGWCTRVILSRADEAALGEDAVRQ